MTKRDGRNDKVESGMTMVDNKNRQSMGFFACSRSIDVYFL